MPAIIGSPRSIADRTCNPHETATVDAVDGAGRTLQVRTRTENDELRSTFEGLYPSLKQAVVLSSNQATWVARSARYWTGLRYPRTLLAVPRCTGGPSSEMIRRACLTPSQRTHILALPSESRGLVRFYRVTSSELTWIRISCKGLVN